MPTAACPAHALSHAHEPAPTPRVGFRRALAGLLLLALGLAGAASTPTPAAAQGEATPAAPAARQAPVPIAVADIGVASERAKSLMKEIADSLEPAADVQAVAAELPELRDLVNERLEISEATRTGASSLPALDQLKTSWRELRVRIDATQERLRSRSQQIETQLERVQAVRGVWNATREMAVERDLGDEVVSQMEQVQTAADATLAKARQRQSEILALQSEVARLSETAVADIKLIDELRLDLVGQFFTQDHPTFWDAELWRFLDPDSIGERLALHTKNEREALIQFFTKRREATILFCLAALFFTLLMVASRPAILRRLEQDELPGVGTIFQRPISLSLLVVFFTAIMNLEQAPPAVIPILAALTLVPAVLILRGLIDPQLFPMMNAVVVIFFVDRLRLLVLSLPVTPRLIFVFEMLTFMLLTAVWLRPARLRNLPKETVTSRIAGVVALGLRAAFVLATAALFAQLAGYTAFANTLGRTLIISAYAAIVLYGTVRVADGIVALLMRVRPLRLLGMVSRNRPLLRKRAFLVIQLSAWFVWLRATLDNAELWDSVVAASRQILAAALPLPEVSITLGDILACGVTFYAAILSSRFIRFALQEDVYTRVYLPKGRPYAISTLIHYTILLIGLVLAATALGFDMNRFTLLAGAFGVGIGFGLQTIVNNFISGIILLTERPIEVGDTVELGTMFGVVQRIGIRSSTVRTWQGAEVLVPNADLISQQVTNWTLSDQRRRLGIPVGVAYGTDPKRVIEILNALAEKEPRVLKLPAPYTLFMGFGDSALLFELRAWTDVFDDYIHVRSALCVEIAAELAEAGIVVPFPQRDLHVKTTPDDAERMQPAPAARPEVRSSEQV